jgi:hypothetical protein
VATYSKLILSGSTDGRAIKVAATSSPGTTIHTGSATAATIDEVWLYAYNSSASAVVLTIQWGSTSTPDDDIKLSIPATSGLTLVVPGLLIKGNATPLVVRAYAATTNVVTVSGYVNRIA